MKYYLEITLKEDQTCDLYTLWSQVYTQLHLALVEVMDEEGRVTIGFSFPDYYFDEIANLGFLGSKCRLFAANKSSLIQLNLIERLSSLLNNLHFSEIQTVPSTINGYASYRKLGKKTSFERQARRHAKRKGVSIEEALAKYSEFEPFRGNFPFVRLKSFSTQQSFRLIVKKTEETELKTGKFNTYGLSAKVTLPEF